MKNKFSLGLLSVAVSTFLLTGCGGNRDIEEVTDGVESVHNLSYLDPHKVDRAVLGDFDNDSTRAIHQVRREATATISVTRMPHGGNLALMVETNRRDITRTEFFVDLDANTATGVQVNRVTNSRDDGMAQNGSVGADLIMVNGAMYYYNLDRRHWRYWYHNWQRLDRMRYTSDPEHGRFIVEIPSNFNRYRNVRANVEPVQIPGSVDQRPGNLDFATVLNRMNGHIRVTVAMATRDGFTTYMTRNVTFNTNNIINNNNNNHAGNNNNNHADNNNNNNNNHADNNNPFGGEFTARVNHNNLVLNVGINANQRGSRSQLFIREANNHNHYSGYLVENSRLYRYSGNGQNWHWRLVRNVQRVANNNSIVVTVPLNQLALDGTVNVGGRLLDHNWRTIRELHRANVILHTENNTHNNADSSSGFSARYHDGMVNIEANIPNNAQNRHVQILISNTGNHNKYSGYLIEDSRLYKYSGDGRNWRWKYVSKVAYTRDTNSLRISVRSYRVNVGGRAKVDFRVISDNWKTRRDLGTTRIR